MYVVSVALDFKNKKLLNNPDIISRGFVNINESMELFGTCKGVVKDTVLNILSDEEVGVYQTRHQIVEKIRRIFRTRDWEKTCNITYNIGGVNMKYRSVF